MIVYFDSSALVKRYVAEAESPEVQTLLDDAEGIGTSLIARAEIAAAIGKAVRMNWLTRANGQKALLDFRADWVDLIGIELTEAVVATADSLAWDEGLRGFDAVHLASALLWQESLSEPVTFAAFDKQLWEAARKLGLAVWPESL